MNLTFYSGGYLWYNMLYNAHSFAYLAMYAVEISVFSLFTLWATQLQMNLIFKIDMSVYRAVLN